MDKKLTDKEIVKALEDTLHRIKGAEHLIVPKEGVKNLCNGLQNALDLINRLQEDKQNLEIELQAMRGAANGFKAENERLKKAYKQCAFERDAYIEIENTAIAEAKAEAYKEFAERLRKESYERIDLTAYVEVSDIENLLKELVGEDNG